MSCRKLATSGNHGDCSSKPLSSQSHHLIDGRQTTPYEQNRSFCRNVSKGAVIPRVVSIEARLNFLTMKRIGRAGISQGQDSDGRSDIRSILKAVLESSPAACQRGCVSSQICHVTIRIAS